jgi:hypothetical protein
MHTYSSEMHAQRSLQFGSGWWRRRGRIAPMLGHVAAGLNPFHVGNEVVDLIAVEFKRWHRGVADIDAFGESFSEGAWRVTFAQAAECWRLLEGAFTDGSDGVARCTQALGQVCARQAIARVRRCLHTIASHTGAASSKDKKA